MKKVYIIKCRDSAYNNKNIDVDILNVFDDFEKAKKTLEEYKKEEINTFKELASFELYENYNNFEIVIYDRCIKYSIIEMGVE